MMISEPMILSDGSDDVAFQQLKREYSKLYIDNKELLEGIYYAASIQQGLFPQERHFKRIFRDYFVFYRPQQIIGGDLYWVATKNNLAYFAVADCTGHGVSGALLSVLAVSFLNYVLHAKDLNNLGAMLNEIDKKWLETFNFSMEEVFDNDWMEITLASFNFETRELKFAGARGAIYLVKDQQLHCYKGNPYPIGGWQIEKNRNFAEQSITVTEGTMIYLSSDGYKDQFGAHKAGRFKHKRLKELWMEVCDLPLALQKSIIETRIDEWKMNQPQTDDICMMGIRV